MSRKCKLIATILVVVLLTSQTAFATEVETETITLSDGEEYVVNGLSEPILSYDPILGMTDECVLDLYEEFLISEGSSASQIDLSENSLDAFVEYAVEKGIINNTQAERAAVTKAVVRASLAMAAEDARTILGLTTASACLDHSLQDNPTNVSITSSDPISKQVKASSECKKIINDFKSYVKGKKLSARTTSGSTALNSTKDLQLALNRVSYVASGTKNSSGVWTLKITFRDTYDFDCDKWTQLKGLKAATINALNSYGKYAQSVGAVVPYEISILVKTTFTE